MQLLLFINQILRDSTVREMPGNISKFYNLRLEMSKNEKLIEFFYTILFFFAMKNILRKNH